MPVPPGTPLQALYALKAQLDGLPLEAVAPQARAAQLSINEDTLLPLIGECALCRWGGCAGCCSGSCNCHLLFGKEPMHCMHRRCLHSCPGAAAHLTRLTRCIPSPLQPATEDEMDSLAHRWHDRWQRTGLPSLTQRLRHKAAARRASLAARLSALGGEGGGPLGLASSSSDASFEAIAAATEETAGVISSWEHASAAPAPWALEAGAAEQAAEPWQAAAAHAGRADAAAAEEPALLARLKLRLLRGSGPHAAVASASVGLSAEAPSATAGSGRPDFVAASPLDAAKAAAGGSGTLASLLSATAGYSAERVRYMQHLLAQ